MPFPTVLDPPPPKDSSKELSTLVPTDPSWLNGLKNLARKVESIMDEHGWMMIR